MTFNNLKNYITTVPTNSNITKQIIKKKPRNNSHPCSSKLHPINAISFSTNKLLQLT